MAKHPVAEQATKGGKALPPAKTMTVYSAYEQKHMQMTLEQAVRESIKAWNSPDWGLSSAWMEEDKNALATMKRCGYVPVLNKTGKFTPMNGLFNFTRVIPEVQ